MEPNLGSRQRLYPTLLGQNETKLDTTFLRSLKAFMAKALGQGHSLFVEVSTRNLCDTIQTDELDPTDNISRINHNYQLVNDTNNEIIKE